jgi:2-keto-3-deoxy-L-rhamnonate aldolase
VGIKEAVKRVTGYGTMEGGRLPIKGKLPEGEWEKWSEVWERIQKTEDSLSEKDFK